MTTRILHGAALVTAVATTATLLTAVPASAATQTRTQCSPGALGAQVCVGVQTTGGDVRGYASVTDPAGGRDLVVTVRSLVLQRRACGGSWQTWTTVRTTGDASTTRDTDTTRWVTFPRGVQFRSVAGYSSENAGPPYTGTSGTATSRAYGTC